MQNSSDDTLKFRRNMKRALIIFAVVEFIVMELVMFHYAQKWRENRDGADRSGYA